MIASENFYKKLIEFEGLKTRAYLDSAGIPTIGIGTIKYPDGRRVKIGDVCTKEQAIEWARLHSIEYAEKLTALTKELHLNQNQFDALLLLMYNIGAGGLADSTVLKRIRSGGNIQEAWMMWNKARVKGKLQPVTGLTNRRMKELELFFLN